MKTETIETIWPDENFAVFGGHVLEQLFRTKEGMERLKNRRYLVRVTIRMHEVNPLSLGDEQGEGAFGGQGPSRPGSLPETEERTE